jgi:acetoin:2,6-dichlorophenolindophenol oxidoreductase subunit beta
MNDAAVAVEHQAQVKMSYMDAIVEAQMEEMTRDKRVILMGEDLTIYGDGKVMNSFGLKRVWNTPISENSFSGMAVGAAMTGIRPVVALTIASFMYLASDQIINQAGKLHFMTGGQMKVPAVFRCTLFHNLSVAAQHSDRPYPMFMNAPGLKIIAPSTPADAKGLLKSAIRDDDPVVFFEDNNLWSSKGMVPTDPDYLIPIGKADVKREGIDITIVSISGCLKPVLAAAKALEAEGISVEVVDPRTLVPLDKETIINSVAKTGRLIVVDNANRTCSAASEIVAIVAEEAFESLKAPIQRLTTPDVHVASSPILEKQLYPNKDGIVATVKKLLQV